MSTAAPAAPKQARLPGGGATAGTRAPGAATKAEFAITSGVQQTPERVGIYGSGGVGKTTLVAECALAGKRPLLIDLERGSSKVEIDRVSSVTTFDELLALLRNESVWKPYDVLALDSVTKAEELIRTHVCASESKKSIEEVGGGWGKGYERVYETFCQLIHELERHFDAGRSIVLIAHDCVASVPNPEGSDFNRYEPRLQGPTGKGKSSVRHLVKEWLDHLAFVQMDVAINKDGKAIGGGTRSIHVTERPHYWAKGRGAVGDLGSIPWKRGEPTFWNHIFNGGK
jgi:hypothetical protein